jgi:hypothetical protein
VFEMKVVVRGLPFQSTTELASNFVPDIATVNAAPPATAELGVIKVMVGGGTLIMNVAGAEVPPPGIGLETVTAAVPGVTMSVDEIAACRLVLET